MDFCLASSNSKLTHVRFRFQPVAREGKKKIEKSHLTANSCHLFAVHFTFLAFGSIFWILPTSVRVVCWGIFGCCFTAKHLTTLGHFGVALSKRCAEKQLFISMRIHYIV